MVIVRRFIQWSKIFLANTNICRRTKELRSKPDEIRSLNNAKDGLLLVTSILKYSNCNYATYYLYRTQKSFWLFLMSLMNHSKDFHTACLNLTQSLLLCMLQTAPGPLLFLCVGGTKLLTSFGALSWKRKTVKTAEGSESAVKSTLRWVKRSPSPPPR